MASNPQLLAKMLPYAGPSTTAGFQRSQYLQDALDNISESVKQNGIRTPTALWSNLLSTALLSGSREVNDRNILKSGMADQQQMAKALLGGFGQPDAQTPTVTPPSAPQSTAPQFAPSAPAAPAPWKFNETTPQQQAALTTPQAAPQPDAAPAPAAAPYSSVPHGLPPTPDEMNYVQSLLQSTNPALFQQGVSMAMDLRKRMVTPPSLPPGFQFQADGSTRDLIHHNDYSPGLKPGTEIGVDETGKKSLFDQGIAGATPQGTVYRGGVNVTTPTVVGGRVQDQQYSPSDLQAMRTNVLKADEYKMADESTKAYNAMVANATKAGGMSAYAMRDTFARAINPGAVARSGTLQAIADARGIPDSVKGFLLNLKGDGDLDANTKQQIINATLPFVQQNYEAAKRLNDSNADWAARHGVDPADVLAPMADAPKPFSLTPPRPRGGTATPPPISTPAHKLTDQELHTLLKQRGLIP